MSEKTKEKLNLKNILQNPVVLIKWLLISVFMGLFAGAVGVGFYYSIHFANDFRQEYPWLIYLLPIGGIVIVFLYHICRMDNDKGTNAVISAARDEKKLSVLVAPLIFITSTITHLLGGSAGKEGAALQIGGAIASGLSKIFRLDEKDRKVIIMCGMSAVFASIFGTPVTAAVFSMEILSVGMIQLSAIVPCAISAIVGAKLAEFCSVSPTGFNFSEVPEITVNSILKVCVLSVLCALLSVFFCIIMHRTQELYKKLFPNRYIRIIVGGVIIVILTLIVGSQEYNGAGMPIIENAFTGNSRYEAFILKLIFTALTLGAGYRGGEIVPVFFTGATFGNVAGRILNISPSFGAGIGLVSLFCGVTNCPITSIILSVELFGGESIVYFLISCALSYMLSGYHSLYHEQRFVLSKLKADSIDEKAI